MKADETRLPTPIPTTLAPVPATPAPTLPPTPAPPTPVPPVLEVLNTISMMLVLPHDTADEFSATQEAGFALAISKQIHVSPSDVKIDKVRRHQMTSSIDVEFSVMAATALSTVEIQAKLLQPNFLLELAPLLVEQGIVVTAGSMGKLEPEVRKFTSGTVTAGGTTKAPGAGTTSTTTATANNNNNNNNNGRAAANGAGTGDAAQTKASKYAYLIYTLPAVAITLIGVSLGLAYWKRKMRRANLGSSRPTGFSRSYQQIPGMGDGNVVEPSDANDYGNAIEEQQGSEEQTY
jgi:hypothetical protein